MKSLLDTVGRIAGATGFLIAVLAIVLRLSGHYRVYTYDVRTLLDGGVAAMVLATLCLVASLAERGRS